MSSGELRVNFGWGWVSLFPSVPYSIRDQSGLHVLGLAFERQKGVHALGGSRRHDFDAWPGELAITSPDVEMFSESETGGEYLALHIHGVTSGVESDTVLTVPRAVLRGGVQAMRLGGQLRRAMLTPHPDRQSVEEQAMKLLAHGLSLLQVPRRQGGRYDDDRHAHLQVLEYIEDTLEGPLRLDEIAEVAGMPVLRFLRSFSSAVGSTPHAYITERRMQRARALLGETAMPIADIAAGCGFSHQSHLGAVLKDRLGLSPRQYRALASGA